MYASNQIARGSEGGVYKAVVKIKKSPEAARAEYRMQRVCAGRYVWPVDLVGNMIVMPPADMDLFSFSVLHKGAIDPKVGWRLIRHVSTALFEIHRRNMVHRDIKLENILIDLNGDDGPVARVSDFGFAATIQPGESLTERLGTLTYIAPEIEAGKPYGQKVDMWSFGVVMYTVVTGYKPFDPRGPSGASSGRGLSYSGLKRWREATLSDAQRDAVTRTLREDPLKRASSKYVLKLKLLGAAAAPKAEAEPEAGIGLTASGA